MKGLKIKQPLDFSSFWGFFSVCIRHCNFDMEAMGEKSKAGTKVRIFLIFHFLPHFGVLKFYKKKNYWFTRQKKTGNLNLPTAFLVDVKRFYEIEFKIVGLEGVSTTQCHVGVSGGPPLPLWLGFLCLDQCFQGYSIETESHKRWSWWENNEYIC